MPRPWEVVGRLIRNRDYLYDAVREGGGLWPKIAALAAAAALASGAYGFAMGVNHSWRQAASSAVKTPLMFLLTLAVTLPALYSMTSLAGGRLRFGQLVMLMVMAVAVTGVVLAAWAPVTFLYGLSGSGYIFMILMNVFVFAVAGAAGAGVMAVSLVRSTRHGRVRAAAIQAIWVVLYGFVGGQMSWALRPFVCKPGSPFAPLRAVSGNFYETVLRIILGGGS
jgi:hypothetical protein